MTTRLGGGQILMAPSWRMSRNNRFIPAHFGRKRRKFGLCSSVPFHDTADKEFLQERQFAVFNSSDMKIIGIATARPGVTQEQLKPHMEAEAKEAWRLYEADIIRENYTRTDHPGVVTVFECESVAQAEQICKGFPLVREGLIDFEFIPLGYFKPWAGNLGGKP